MAEWWNVKETVSEALRTVLSDIAEDLISSGMKYLTEYISSPIDLEEIPFFKEFVIGAKAIGASLVILFLYIRLLQAMRDMATGEDDPNFAEIIGSSAISMGFVFSFDIVIKKYIIPIINEVVEWLGGFKIEVNLAKSVLDGIAPGAGLDTAAIHILFIAVIFGIGAFVLTIAAFLTTAHAFIAVIVGPVVMASHTNRSGAFKSYLTELGAVLFTKIIHVITFILVLATASKGTFEMLLLSFAFMCVGAMGPHVLRIYLLNSGVAAGSTSTARFAAYKVMFSGLKK